MVKSQQLLNEASLVGLYAKPTPSSSSHKKNSDNGIFNEKEEEEGLKLCKELSQLSFWCGNNKLHIKNPNYSQNSKRCCLTHTVGLPRHPATNAEMPLTPYQVDFFNTVDKITSFSKKNAKKYNVKNNQEWLRKHHLFHINKGRQMGFTEIVLRIMQYYCFTRYAGYKIAIQAGTTGSLAQKDLRRFARLFLNIKPVVRQWIKSRTFELVNDTVTESFSASEEAMTGDTRYKAIFQDESAKWRLVEDQPVFDSIMPIVKSAGGDLFLVSTPKGPRKMFYDIHKNPGDFYKLKYDIWETKGNLYTEQEIEEKLATTTEDADQEYLCHFSVGKDSIFGVVSTEDQQGKNEWIIDEEEGEEDDDYTEPKDDDNGTNEIIYQ